MSTGTIAHTSSRKSSLSHGQKGLARTRSVCSSVVGAHLPLLAMEGLKGHRKQGPYPVESNNVPDFNHDRAINHEDVEHLLRHDKNASRPLKQGGDFRSAECVEILKQADIVVTNPPFSLFREFIAQLVEHGKQFLIIGSKNAITYKEVFKLIKENKLWLGVGFNAGNAYFEIPKENVRDFASGVYDEKTGLVKFRNVGCFTNMDFEERHQDIPLFKEYSPEAYPTYDNYGAINVNKTADIPEDYDGAMGVPITFFDKYNPEQFEILNANDLRRSENTPFKPHGLIKDKDSAINGKPTYVRVVIRHKRKRVAPMAAVDRNVR